MKTKGFCFQLPLINIRRESAKMNLNRRKTVGVSFSGTRGEGFGKLHIKVLLTQRYSGGKCASVYAWSLNMFSA